MAESITFNNATYIVPDVGESNWGQNLTNFFVAIPQGCYQLSGGTAPLTADLNFGSSFGLFAKYLTSVTASPATAGVVRLANTDAIEWRNHAGSGNLPLAVDTSNNLLWNGDIIATSSTSPVLSIAGTSNEITASAATGNVTLSIPSTFIAPGSIAATTTLAGTTLTGNATTNQILLGTTKVITISSTAPASSQTYTLPDAGGAANVVLDHGNYTIAGTWGFSNSITLASSKAVILTDDSTHTVMIKATNSTTTYTLQLPTTAGSNNYFLQTDGSGNTTWAPGGAGTVSSGTAGNLTLYPSSSSTVSDTYVQNTHNITIGIATQAARSAALAITIPNPGNAVTSGNIIIDSDTNSYTLSGTYTLPNALTITPTTNQLVLGTTRTITLSATQPASSSRTYTFPDKGANSNVMMSSTALVDNTRVNAAGYIIGTVVQTVQSTDTSNVTSSGTGFTSTSTAASITPKATTHVIRISVTGSLYSSNLTSVSAASIFRGASDLSGGSGFTSLNGAAGAGRSPCSIVYEDSPATTSSTTYTVKIKSTVSADAQWCVDGSTNVILLEEIAA